MKNMQISYHNSWSLTEILVKEGDFIDDLVSSASWLKIITKLMGPNILPSSGHAHKPTIKVILSIFLQGHRIHLFCLSKTEI